MTDFILSIDPGLENGISLLSFTEDTLPKLEHVTQFGGGAEGMRDWIKRGGQLPLRMTGTPAYSMGGDLRYSGVEVICEAFTARATKGFSYTTASLEALPVIGVLVGAGLVDRTDKKRYRDPKYQYLVGGKDLADKKKRRDRFLKESGFYVTPKELGAPDANDARSAISHGLNFLVRELKHKPTWKLVTDWTEQNGN